MYNAHVFTVIKLEWAGGSKSLIKWNGAYLHLSFSAENDTRQYIRAKSSIIAIAISLFINCSSNVWDAYVLQKHKHKKKVLIILYVVSTGHNIIIISQYIKKSLKTKFELYPNVNIEMDNDSSIEPITRFHIGFSKSCHHFLWNFITFLTD